MTRELFSERPDEIWVEVLNARPGGTTIIHIAENINEVQIEQPEGKTSTAYEADTYSVITGFREGLVESIKQDKEIWISAAKQKDSEEKAKTLQERVSELETMTGDLAAAMLG